jgi:molybdopterin-guanine dinucleotide biosynthesis protein A
MRVVAWCRRVQSYAMIVWIIEMAASSTELTGFVLAGGASRRMGSPKHELVLGGETLLARTVRRAMRVARPVMVLGPPDRTRGLDAGLAVRALPDELPGRGPLSAIHTGLSHTHTEFNLFLSCDLPFMEPRFLHYLAAIAHATGADVTLARTPREGYQPLAAIYRRRALPAVRRSLANGQNRITRFFRHVQLTVIDLPELARAGFRSSIFDNLNTREDYARAARRIDGSGPR